MCHGRVTVGNIFFLSWAADSAASIADGVGFIQEGRWGRFLSVRGCSDKVLRVLSPLCVGEARVSVKGTRGRFDRERWASTQAEFDYLL